MINLAQKIQYDIVSSPLDIAQEPRQDVVYKISFNTESLQVPQLRLFTQDVRLLDHLERYGFFLSDHLLTSQAISYVGQLAADELLIREDLQCDHGKGGRQEQYQRKRAVIESWDRSQIIEQVQQQLREAQQEESKLWKDDLHEQSQFKLKLTLLLQKTIYLLKVNKAKNNNYAGIINNLNQTINLIDNYHFDDISCNLPHHAENPSSQTYDIDPNLLGRITTLDDVQKFYLVINNFNTNHPAVRITREELQLISDERKKYNSRYSVTNLINFIYHHPLRTLCFCLFVFLECLLLPSVTPFLAGFKFLTFFGLHKTFVLIPFCISYTFSFTNFLFEIPSQLMGVYKRFSYKKYDLSSEIADSAININKQRFQKVLASSTAFNTHGNKPSKSKNFLTSIPIIRYLSKIIAEEYKNYSNWYFTYIQRNPISLLLYIIIRVANFFLRILTPLSSLIYCTYFDIDRSINLKAIKKEPTSAGADNKCSEYKEQIPQHTLLSKTKTSKFSSFFSNAVSFTKEAFVMLFVKFPVGLAFIFSKILLSSLYLSLYLLFNLTIEIFRFINAQPIYEALFSAEQKITDFYSRTYYAYSYQYDYLQKIIDQFFFSKIGSDIDRNTLACELLSSHQVYHSKQDQLYEKAGFCDAVVKPMKQTRIRAQLPATFSREVEAKEQSDMRCCFKS